MSIPKATARLLARPMVVVALLALPAFALPSPTSAAPARTLVDTAPLLGPLRVVAPFGIATSLWRSAEHNRRVGGMPNSYHLSGRAIDVQRRPGVSHAMLDAALRRAGFVPIESIDEIDHSHFAFLPAGSNPTVSRSKAATVTTVAPPSKPAEPRVAADLHGTLLIDAVKPVASSAVIASSGSAPSSGAAN
ncbi:D-Ala-D-Ala carboxypeptidase family metallohydrolase [Sphingomonas kaistensis]|uniref:D-Ala-D-Ala carboxypeptidase family metallohydrolase n=1 Tax=Sphingomonas kaistensis TaxID=298708 RepID=A0ABZ2FYE6_9SPHN